MSRSRDQFGWIAWLVGPGFVGVAAWLVLAPPKADIPRGEVALVPIEEIKPGPWRTPLLDASKAMVQGQIRPCSECHRLFAPASGESERVWVQHKDITINHGMNTRCLNCHDGADRDKLVLHDGTLVTFSESPRLCSNCHGTVYRDWQRGTHGKTVGSWDATSGKQERLRCNECHDPHSPAYKPIAPLAGPTTLRMGDQTRHHSPNEKTSPLRKWSEAGDAERDAHGASEHTDAKPKTEASAPTEGDGSHAEPAKEGTP